MLKTLKLIKKNCLYNKHCPSILVSFLGETEHFSGKSGAFLWSILVGKQKHNVQKPTFQIVERGSNMGNHSLLTASGTYIT